MNYIKQFFIIIAFKEIKVFNYYIKDSKGYNNFITSLKLIKHISINLIYLLKSAINNYT
jgi:hypothetical protein